MKLVRIKYNKYRTNARNTYNAEYDEIYFRLGYDTVPFGNWFPTFHETNPLSQNVREHLSSDRVSYHGRKKVSATSLRKFRDMLIIGENE